VKLIRRADACHGSASLPVVGLLELYTYLECRTFGIGWIFYVQPGYGGSSETEVMNKLLKITSVAVLAVGAAWTFLTVFAERAGPKRSWRMGDQTAKKRALISYDPDPFYNLDEQVSRSFGQALADQGMQVTVATLAAAGRFDNQPIDLYVFCANTYNWRPDWAMSNFIEKQVALTGKSVVAITLGSGSTEASQKALESLLVAQKARLLDSRSLWLLKPNDESRMNEANVDVAVSMAYTWGEEIAKRHFTTSVVSAPLPLIKQP
jgi:hypothetical protein